MISRFAEVFPERAERPYHYGNQDELIPIGLTTAVILLSRQPSTASNLRMRPCMRHITNIWQPEKPSAEQSPSSDGYGYDCSKIPEKGRQAGKLDEPRNNACTVKIDVDVEGKTEKMALLFKNETLTTPQKSNPLAARLPV